MSKGLAEAHQTPTRSKGGVGRAGVTGAAERVGERQNQRRRLGERQIKRCAHEMIEKQTTSADDHVGIACVRD